MTANMDKPVHKVLEDYDLLNVSAIQKSNTINMSAAMLWRMNLCATSNDIPCTFFVAMNYRVNVYTIDTAYSPFKDPHKILISPGARQTGGASESPYVINSIKIDRLLQKEVLVTTSENGEVCIWRTENLDEPPMVLSNEVATWGIAIHADQGLVAVSGNNWRITIFNILEMTRENPIFGSTNKRTNIMGNELKMELIGHEHNIPNIDFSETGQYIASASIDQTCRVWDITTKKVVTQKKTPSPTPGEEHDSRCWSVKFIKPGHFKYAVCIDKSINKSFLQRVCQGRSTALKNLGLCHSAISPVFPINVSNVHDLGNEEIDFSIYDTDEVDATTWDNSLSQEEEDFMEEVFERQRQEGNFYNHGEIPDTNHNPTHTSSNTDESDISDADDDDTPIFRLENPVTLTDSLEGVIQDEVEFENLFNRGLREENRGSDEIIQQQSRESGQESDNIESQESRDPEEEHEDANDNYISMWTAEVPALPAQDDWTRSVVNDNTGGNRDGWGDEIVSVMRNSSIDDIASISDEPTSDSLLNNNGNNQVHLNRSRDGLGTRNANQNNVTDTPNAGNIRPSINMIKSTNHLQDKKENGKQTNRTLGEYLMISTGKDIMMLGTNRPKMSRIRAEYNVISKIDVRSDQMLSVLDRINMVEWLPELELFVAASQKGTVALTRILQVEFEGGEQACIFNNECYLPTGVFQATPLYGMTVKRIESERFTPISYQIFLFYYSGNVLGYTVSRKDCDLMVENFIV